MEQHIVAEVAVKVPLPVAAISCTTAIHVAAKDVDDAVLNFFCDVGQVHVVATASRALDLELCLQNII